MKSYDVSQGAFTTFSKVFIMHEISKQINFTNNNSTVHYNNLQKKINDAITKLKEENLEITPTKIAVMTDLKPEIVKREMDYIECTKFRYLDAGECNEQPCEYDSTPEAIAAKREKETVLKDGLLSLPEDIRLIVTLRVQGCKNEEIARITNLNVGKVKNKFQKGILLMRKDPRIINAYPERFTTAEIEMLQYSMPVSTSEKKVMERIDDTLSAMGILAVENSSDDFLNIELSFKNL